MVTNPTLGSPGRHCYGLVLHHRASWWLVEFLELDASPHCARKLSGRLTPALTQWLRSETSDPSLPGEIASLNPGSQCWAGEFSWIPAAGGDSVFDLDAHPWGSEAGELETRLARGLIAGEVEEGAKVTFSVKGDALVMK